MKDYKGKSYDFTPNFDGSQSYALGLLWADGWLISYKGVRSRRLGLDVVETDFYDFEEALRSLGKLRYKKRQRINRQPQITSTVSDKALCEWLYSMGFSKKSIISPTLLLEYIPSEYVKDFIRGWIDGDGCFYCNPKLSMSQFTIAGSYDQDWSSFIDILTNLDITKFKLVKNIQTQNNKVNKGSIIRITNRKDITKLYNYIYNNPTHFLKRKYELCKRIVNMGTNPKIANNS